METTQSKRYWGIIIKVLKEKMVNLEYFTSENIFQKRRQNKNFFKHKTALSSADMLYNKCLKRHFNEKENDTILCPHKGMKSTRNGKYIGKYETFLSFFNVSLKDN